jgi:hypothetical protein
MYLFLQSLARLLLEVLVGRLGYHFHRQRLLSGFVKAKERA